MISLALFALFIGTQIADVASSALARPFGYEVGPIMAPTMRAIGFWPAFGLVKAVVIALAWVLTFRVAIVGPVVLGMLIAFYADVVWHNLRVAKIV